MGLIALLVLLAMGGYRGMLLIDGPMEPRNDLASIPVERLIGAVMITFSMLMAPPLVVAGRALLQWKPWSRIFAMLASGLYMLNFPFGTALGLYTMWVLSDETCEFLFDNAPGNRKR